MKFHSLLEKLKSALGGESPSKPASSLRPSQKKGSTPTKPKTVPAYQAVPSPSAPPRSESKLSSQPPQAEIPPKAKPEIDLFIGFDLGTSSSKVVIGNPEMESSFPVVFCEDKEGVAQFLLPTSFRETSDGCQLARSDPGTHSNFKLRLMNSSERKSEDAEEDIVDLTIYAALVLREVLQWFHTTHGRDYAHFDIVWNLAVGFPKKEVRKRGKLENVYRKALHAASILIGKAKPVTRNEAREALDSVIGGAAAGGMFEPGLIALWPEIAAQLAGYMRSPYHRNGNLVLVDIGAGTLDVSAIILHGGAESRKCSFHHCAVKPLGAYRLYQARQEVLLGEGVEEGELKPVFSKDPLARVPEGLVGYVNRGVKITPRAKRAFDIKTRGFIDECIETVRERMVSFRKAQKEAHLNTGFDPWPGRLPVILSGGGSRLKLYDHAFRKDLEEKIRPFTRWAVEKSERERQEQGLETVLMPVPDDLKTDVALQFDFDRISVAHGLAYGAENLPQITSTNVGRSTHKTIST